MEGVLDTPLHLLCSRDLPGVVAQVRHGAQLHCQDEVPGTPGHQGEVLFSITPILSPLNCLGDFQNKSIFSVQDTWSTMELNNSLNKTMAVYF